MCGDHSNLKSRPYEPAHVSEVGSEPLSLASAEYKRHPMYSPREWLLETITSILSLGFLIGIAGIFWYMDNKPLSAWSARVSLSATISVLTTGYTAALMHGVSQFIGQLKWLHFKTGSRKLSHFETFDAASRGGIWGSIMLLTTVKWNLATIGAFITIMRLTFAPFAQQVVLFQQRPIYFPDDRVTFGYAHKYFLERMGEMPNPRIQSIPQDPNMQSAVVQGLYGINTAATFSCPGECRWTGSYISLGFKSQCKNVTQETLRSAKCDGNEYSTQCNMTTPGGLGISTRYYFTDWATNYFLNASSMLGNLTSLALPDTFPEIARFAVYRSTPNFNLQPENINITECSLSLTAYKYIEAKSNGSDFSFGKIREVDFGGTNPWKRATGEYEWGWLYTNESKTDNIPALEILYYNLAALENFLVSPTIVTEWVEGNFENKNLGLAAALSGDVNIDERFQKMAASMTDYLRRGPNAEAAHGERIESQPFVSIRWPYFIPPLATELMAILFAVLTIFSNRKDCQVPLWKTSTLAVLACQHEKQLGLLHSTVKDIKELQESAGKTEVRLQ
ncbi:hypothetical protein CNMCM8980_004907 [Aspergillus fumigatiaffinis]|uniref:Uncharacterized protein n=1 Tax=Aspergillus fumigatiaffinis TaxID=340414 RepID=A0A8H4H2L5_9EURO|nr:hypothetical protein CNMCM5878_004826 [Aspergillus fumigatiaffinis]KAF4216698.1 hypothetical protein CNMCM6457_004900 [Aspergillus fumigatiaffinis]KAF4232375.1 hypothetical protein CNMCM8980_004907 [Aspergillus fumigatiaffinis]KAF4234164.1 hypothetical protein CNMCM6805_008870 [Aspergillus fumigatiaffinis]